jgi:hypothetical protein
MWKINSKTLWGWALLMPHLKLAVEHTTFIQTRLGVELWLYWDLGWVF